MAAAMCGFALARFDKNRRTDLHLALFAFFRDGADRFRLITVS